MNLVYGFVKCKITSDPILKPSQLRNETQYHLHANLAVQGQDGQWDTAINVGTDDSDDLLKYKLIMDFQHDIIAKLKLVPPGYTNLTGTTTLPALDFLRSDVLANTGDWCPSDTMDGSLEVEPVASLLRALRNAIKAKQDVYIFGRIYTEGNGIHDIHMNQGSVGKFINNGRDNHNDHNDIWQDGAVFIDVGQPRFIAYFTTFTQQQVPTNDLGNPLRRSHPITEADEGSLIGG